MYHLITMVYSFFAFVRDMSSVQYCSALDHKSTEILKPAKPEIGADDWYIPESQIK